MSKQFKLIQAIESAIHSLNNMHSVLSELDKPARDAYNKTIDPNAPNMYITSWEELSETQREMWREKVSG